MTDLLTPLEFLVYGTFIFSLFSMIGASAFFFCSHGQFEGGYRYSVLLSGVITLVAGLTYFYMTSIYLDAAKAGSGQFPTLFRYIDWFITVPLMLVKFPSLLGMGPQGIRFMTKLVAVSLIMLVTAFIGEVTFDQKAMHFGFYGVSVMAWIYIVYSLATALSSLPDGTTETKRLAIRRMFFFIFIGWLIYPIGYLMPTFGMETDYRELLYNIGDVINKVGLGLVVTAAAIADRKNTSHI